MPVEAQKQPLQQIKLLGIPYLLYTLVFQRGVLKGVTKGITKLQRSYKAIGEQYKPFRATDLEHVYRTLLKPINCDICVTICHTSLVMDILKQLWQVIQLLTDGNTERV